MPEKAPRNRTLTVTDAEKKELLEEAVSITSPCGIDDLSDRIINQDLLSCSPLLPESFIDLLIIDPPYNLSKKFATTSFTRKTEAAYRQWLNSWLPGLKRCLKETASLYICCDWYSSKAMQSVLEEHFTIRNRITWEREKGRGAKRNWKNCSEDIWFCTKTDDYFFNVDAVKLKRRVIAPYRHASGAPKDWREDANGNFRLTHPSNLWTDISVPFWSMPENTDHPTQKPEKLIAKLILASSRPGDFIFDPFSGSGTTCVVAKKLKRHFAGVEIEADYCAMALKRLALAAVDKTIQGYHEGCFLERNTPTRQKTKEVKKTKPNPLFHLFE